MKLPANWNKHKLLSGFRVDKAATKAAEQGMEPMSGRNTNKQMQFVGSFWNWAGTTTIAKQTGLKVRSLGKNNGIPSLMRSGGPGRT